MTIFIQPISWIYDNTSVWRNPSSPTFPSPMDVGKSSYDKFPLTAVHENVFVMKENKSFFR